MLPRWYLAIWVFWVLVAAPLWWFATGNFGASFFPLPTPSLAIEPDEGWLSAFVIQWAFILAFYAPAIFLPLALYKALRRSKVEQATSE